MVNRTAKRRASPAKGSYHYVVESPETGRPIKVGGPTWNRLAESSVAMARKLKSLPKHRRANASKARGSSNAGKYRPGLKYCGPAGGAAPGTYPVNTPKRAVAALSYARNAPRPAGIRACVHRQAKQKGWERPNGTIAVGPRRK